MRLITCLLCLSGVAALAQHRSSLGTVEPDARLWRPWLLTSASEIRPDAPPHRADSARELLVVRTAVNDPTPDLAARVAYWNAGSPNYRWQQIAIANTGLSSFPGFRALALMNVAIADAEIATWDAKYFYNRRRPAQADPALKTRIATPDSPSYPSEHAAAAGAAAAVLSYLFPCESASFQRHGATGWRRHGCRGNSVPERHCGGARRGPRSRGTRD
jgi:membrane-associated phospholipid phosphatase